MADLKSFDDPLWRRSAGELGDLQRMFADKLVEINSPLAFLPYFLTGGHDTADALENIQKLGINRPLSATDPDTGKRINPRARSLMDLLGASQVGVYGGALAKGGQVAKKGLMSLFDNLLAIPYKEGRREALKKGSAVAGQAAIPTPLKIAAAAAAGGAAAKIAPAVAKKFKYNSLAEYLTALKKMTKSDDQIKDMLYDRDIKYSVAKNNDVLFNPKNPQHKELINSIRKGDIDPPGYHMNVDYERKVWEQERQILDEFSPRAKEEMKAMKEIFGPDWIKAATNDTVLESIKKGRIPSGMYDPKSGYVQRGIEYYTPDYKFHPRNDLAQKPGYYLFDETGTDYLNPISAGKGYTSRTEQGRDFLYEYEPLKTREEVRDAIEKFQKLLNGDF